MPGRIRRFVRAALNGIVRVLLVLVLLEGTASWLGFALNLPLGLKAPERERLYMQHDPELGWSHVPGTRLQDFYGSGRHLTISRQGLRAARTLAQEPTPQLVRTVCAGGELTLGVGVGDDDTWCARLGARESGLETINMGQSGYGLDQSYLWYRRDGARLGTQLLIFAFTRDGFARMERDRFGAYAKPTLRVASNGALQARNVPVPRPTESATWLVRHAPLFAELRIVELAQPAFRDFLRESPAQLTTGQLAALSLEIFEALQALTREHGATLVLVYLPTREDYGRERDLWRRRIASEARSRGIAFVDLVEEQNSMAASEIEALYAWPASLDLAGQTPILTETGHTWVARTLSAHLRRLPEVVATLGPAAGGIP